MKIAIDGGHQKSRSISCNDTSSNSPPYPSPKPMNLRTESSSFTNCVMDHINHQLKNRKNERDEKVEIAISLPGCATTWQRTKYAASIKKIQNTLRQNDINVETIHLIDDTWAALLTESEELNGISVICGHGSTVAYISGQGPSDTIKLDGLGPLLGDNSSGYYLALCTLRHLCINKHDSICTELLNGIKTEMENDNFLSTCHPSTLVKDPVQWIDILHSEKAEQIHSIIASIAKAVFTTGEKITSKPLFLQEIENSMVNHIAGQINKALEVSAPCDKPKKLVLQGGLIRHNDRFANSVKQLVEDKAKLKKYEVVSSKKPHVDGTMKYLKKFSGGLT